MLENYPTLNHFLHVIKSSSPVINKTLSDYGNQTIQSYLKRKPFCYGNSKSYQEKEDLIEVVFNYTESLLEKDIAYKLAIDITNFPVVLTANHHGVDYFAQSVQGTLLFSLRGIANQAEVSTTPVFAFGNVPLNSITYPRGLLLYDVSQKNIQNAPLKIPLFADQYKRAMVSTVAGINEGRFVSAENRITEISNTGDISARLTNTLKDVLNNIYRSNKVLCQSSYSQQSVLLNSLIWKKLTSKVKFIPELVYLEIEKIVSKILEYDLSNPISLAWISFFNSTIREHILNDLDGVTGCWTINKQLCSSINDAKNNKTINPLTHGTHFFWGIDNYGRRIQLYLAKNVSSNLILRGVDDEGQIWEFAFTPDALIEKIHTGKLLPSIFTCFLVVAFARGLTCIGGYYQAEYLPAIQRVLVNILLKTGFETIANCVSSVSTNMYLSGMQTIMCQIDNNFLIPAGPLEIISNGGLDHNDIDRILESRIYYTHIASLFETISDILTNKNDQKEWKEKISNDYYNFFKDDRFKNEIIIK